MTFTQAIYANGNFSRKETFGKVIFPFRKICVENPSLETESCRDIVFVIKKLSRISYA